MAERSYKTLGLIAITTEHGTCSCLVLLKTLPCPPGASRSERERPGPQRELWIRHSSGCCPLWAAVPGATVEPPQPATGQREPPHWEASAFSALKIKNLRSKSRCCQT